MDCLTKVQLQKYHKDGYLFPLNIFSHDEINAIRSELESIEAQSENGPELKRYLALNAHYIFEFVAEAARHPAILDAVESILGPDILAWGSELFLKEPLSPSYVSWHQDLTYWGMGSTEKQVTAWIALTDSFPLNGCMKFYPGSHRSDELLTPIDTFAENNALSRGQELPIEIDDDTAVDVCLSAGQVSLHHGRMYHSSGSNRSTTRRIGLTLRYITPDVIPSKLGKDFAMLVRGTNSSSYFDLIPPPNQTLGEIEKRFFETVANHQAALYVRPDEKKKPKWERITWEESDS